MSSSPFPSTPPRRSVTHSVKRVSPYFSRILPISPASSKSIDESDSDVSPSFEKSRPSKRTEAFLTASISERCQFIDDETYIAHGISPQLLKEPLFAFNLRKFARLYASLWHAKPILIQERVANEPWKLLVAVMLLNKTSGKLAIPVFWKIMDECQWATSEALSQANPADLKALIQPLGLHDTRSKRLVKLSKAYVADPPCLLTLRPTKYHLVSAKDSLAGEAGLVVKERYPPTPISHLPGSGPYALDSYRIFCMPGDEWKRVMPADKELIRFMRWKWALFEQRHWDPVHGVIGAASIEYLAELSAQLKRTS